MKVTLENVRMVGGKTGLKTTGPVEVDAKGVSFENVETPFDLGPGSTGRFRDNHIFNDPKLRFPSRVDKVTKGWRRPCGPPLPAYCPECKHVFASQNYVFAGPFFYCWGNTEECIVCGYEHAELSKGVFDLSHETVEILRAPEITHQMLRRLLQLGKEVTAGRLTSDELINAANDIHPRLGERLKAWAPLVMSGAALYFTIIGYIVDQKAFNDIIADDAQSVLKAVFNSLPDKENLLHDNSADQIGDEDDSASQRENGYKPLNEPDRGEGGKNATPESVELTLKSSVPVPKPKPHY
jgi:hypothetical protein